MERLKRKIDEYLIEWKSNSNRLPLIIKGARQIGKTNAIRNFGENNYKKLKFIPQKYDITKIMIQRYKNA